VQRGHRDDLEQTTDVTYRGNTLRNNGGLITLRHGDRAIVDGNFVLSGMGYTTGMCRNIRTLHHFKPPTTPAEIRAAALQYVRKVSGIREPAKDADAAFARAIDQVEAATAKLLGALPKRGEPRTREGEREKARARWVRRERELKRA
jgi:hypothetical protein